jgi:hypothetical protein
MIDIKYKDGGAAVYSEQKKEDLIAEKAQANGAETPEDIECDCELCLMQRKPKLTFESSKGHRWYYQTNSRKRTHK